jgi:hypothetical protein
MILINPGIVWKEPSAAPPWAKPSTKKAATDDRIRTIDFAAHREPRPSPPNSAFSILSTTALADGD